MKRITLVLLAALLSCAVAVPQGRIVGGDDAVLGQIPYQAALSIAGLYTCGAAILSERYAITALRCVTNENSNKPWPAQMYKITAGTVDLYTGGSRITLKNIIVNPNYTEWGNGIALLELSEPLVFSDNIQAIPLSKTLPPLSAEVEISGWGHIKESETEMYRTLQINEAIVTENNECYLGLGRIDNHVLCLKNLRRNGICHGDFGGPAVYQGKLVGIAATLIGECGSLMPNVFTSIASNYDWIVSEMK